MRRVRQESKDKMRVYVCKGLHQRDVCGILDERVHPFPHRRRSFSERGESPEEAKSRADEIIKNTYRTLLTRGMKGCYIYCTDPGMTAYLKKRLERVKHEAGNSFKDQEILR